MSSISVEDIAKEYGVSVEYLKKNEVSDEHVLLFSKFCDPWEEMAPYFGYEQATISAIARDHHTTELKRRAMIQKWKEGRLMATYYTLIGIFLKCDKVASAKNICSILRDSMPALKPSSSDIQPAKQLLEDPAPQHPTPPRGPVSIDIINNSPLGCATGLTMNDHSKITLLLENLAPHQMMNVGGALGLNYSKMQNMKNLPNDIVHSWINRDDNVTETPSVTSLAKALRKVGHNGVAAQVEEAFK